MGRYKLTDKILKNISYYAEEQYSLEDIFEELNISKKLLEDKCVLQAYEKGLMQLYISKASSGMSDVDIANSYEITKDQCILWREQYKDVIDKTLQKKEDERKCTTRHFSHPLMSGMVNILEQYGKEMSYVSEDVLKEDIKTMVEKMQSGDTTALVTMLTTNIIQLQLFNGIITHNIMGDIGKQLENFNKLSNMQLKVMQETRKSIMAINEITNPKHATFIKEANQHNYLHKISEKKYENQNELQKQLEKPDAIMDAAIYVDDREENEKK